MMALDSAYTTWFHAKIAAWVRANREQYKALRIAVWEKTRRGGQPMPTDGSFASDYLNGLICEEIRRLNAWPSERQYDAGTRLPVETP